LNEDYNIGLNKDARKTRRAPVSPVVRRRPVNFDKCKHKVPFLVKYGLIGITKRRSALGWMFGSLVGGGLLAFALWDWIFAILGLLAALWYFYALRWVDKHYAWP